MYCTVITPYSGLQLMLYQREQPDLWESGTPSAITAPRGSAFSRLIPVVLSRFAFLRTRFSQAADTLTQLGILWASRGYVRRSLLYLLASVSFLREISSLASLSDTIRHDGNPSTSSSSSSRNDTIGDECIVSDGSSATAETKATSSGAGNGDSEPDDVRHNKERKQEKHRNLRAKLESLLTHAYYFLAQVSRAAGDAFSLS